MYRYFVCFITFFRYVDELDHVAMVESSGSSDSNNTITQGGCLCTVGTSVHCTLYSYQQKSGSQKLSRYGDAKFLNWN
jgi:hypothetical protein